jgi:hypothetical protein
MTVSRLLDFYRGVGTDSEGRTLAQLWAYSEAKLETTHDFIQWLFPLREPSRFNPDAPLLTDSDIVEFRNDPRLKESLRRSLDVFLAFVGLRFEGDHVVEAKDFDRKQVIWRHPNHNWLRITRVLASTRLLGLKEESRAFYALLENLRGRSDSGITDDTFEYWRNAAGQAGDRDAMG